MLLKIGRLVNYLADCIIKTLLTDCQICFSYHPVQRTYDPVTGRHMNHFYGNVTFNGTVLIKCMLSSHAEPVYLEIQKFRHHVSFPINIAEQLCEMFQCYFQRQW